MVGDAGRLASDRGLGGGSWCGGAGERAVAEGRTVSTVTLVTVEAAGKQRCLKPDRVGGVRGAGLHREAPWPQWTEHLASVVRGRKEGVKAEVERPGEREGGASGQGAMHTRHRVPRGLKACHEAGSWVAGWRRACPTGLVWGRRLASQ